VKRGLTITSRRPQTGVFSFTPLLAGASVGTLELRCTTENVRRYSKQINFAEAWADNVDFTKKQITCVSTVDHERS
jgi:NADH dehydrogenase FAD-containing subunit